MITDLFDVFFALFFYVGRYLNTERRENVELGNIGRSVT